MLAKPFFFNALAFQGPVMENVKVGGLLESREIVLRPCFWANAHDSDDLRSAFY